MAGQLRVDEITNEAGTGSPTFPNGLDSSSLVENLTVSSTGAVTAQTVVNLSSNGIGNNPVPATPTSLVNTAANFTWQTYDNLGLLLLRAEFSGGVQYRPSVRQSDGSFVWAASPTQVTTSTSGTAPYGIIDHLGGAFYFAGMGTVDPNAGPRTATGRCIELNPSTGALLASSNTVSVTSAVVDYAGYAQAIVRGIKTDIPNRFVLQETRDNSVFSPGGGTSRLATITSSGAISSTQNAGTTEGFSGITQYGWFLLTNNKVLGVRNNAAFRIADYNGSSFQNFSTITVDSDYASGAFAWYRPSPSANLFVGAYKDTGDTLKLKIYEYNTGTNAMDVRDTLILATGANNNFIGSISGTGTDIVVAWQTDGVGYVSTHTISTSSKTFTGRGVDVLITTAARTPFVSGPNTSTNIYSAFYNNTSNGVSSRRVTVNAYASPPFNPIGVAQTNGSANQTIPVVVGGIAGGFTGLTVGTVYYYDTALYTGALTTSPSSGVVVGIAISSTELLLQL
jgi:hypothetical protein